MTKPITTIAVMQLVEQGKIDLDRDVSDYLPRLANLQVAFEHCLFLSKRLVNQVWNARLPDFINPVQVPTITYACHHKSYANE